MAGLPPMDIPGARHPMHLPAADRHPHIRVLPQVVQVYCFKALTIAMEMALIFSEIIIAVLSEHTTLLFIRIILWSTDGIVKMQALRNGREKQDGQWHSGILGTTQPIPMAILTTSLSK